jgi:DNA polymerase-3 subunit gamma/tau
MACIAKKDPAEALSILNGFYAEGKDMAALLDELACLTRDFMILQSAPKEGIAMLSGVASDSEVKSLAAQFSSGELVRMLNIIQNTTSGFSRSASRRMDAELCIINLCMPQLDDNMESLLARLTRIEDDLQSGIFSKPIQTGSAEPIPMNAERNAQHADETVKHAHVEVETPASLQDQAPAGFWADVASAVRREAIQAISGFFATTQNAPLRGILNGDTLSLVCANKFIMDMVNKPDVLELVGRKAAARLARQVRVVVVDEAGMNVNNTQMERLLDFGRAHSDLINIKEF